MLPVDSSSVRLADGTHDSLTRRSNGLVDYLIRSSTDLSANSLSDDSITGESVSAS